MYSIPIKNHIQLILPDLSQTQDHLHNKGNKKYLTIQIFLHYFFY